VLSRCRADELCSIAEASGLGPKFVKGRIDRFRLAYHNKVVIELDRSETIRPDLSLSMLSMPGTDCFYHVVA